MSPNRKVESVTVTDESTTPAAISMSMPRLNEPAPAFTAVTTDGELSLADFAGKWVVLFSHPADFTPVCTTEFVGFSQRWDQFQERNVQLIGLSIDSVYSHIAWLKNIEDNFDVQVPFPVIADLDLGVASKYGMVQPAASETHAVRAVFIIDPDQILRAMIYYPLTTGRNMDEIVRVIDALQINTSTGMATPANWQPGDQLIVPPPTTKDQADKRATEGYETVDWYFSKPTNNKA
jgi:peroxiredoxin (alkyl hydroperoxide reductase subunit C)